MGAASPGPRLDAEAMFVALSINAVFTAAYGEYHMLVFAAILVLLPAEMKDVGNVVRYSFLLWSYLGLFGVPYWYGSFTRLGRSRPS